MSCKVCAWTLCDDMFVIIETKLLKDLSKSSSNLLSYELSVSEVKGMS